MQPGKSGGKESSYWGINLLLVIAYHYTLKSSRAPTLFPLNLRLLTSAREIFFSFCGIEMILNRRDDGRIWVMVV
ncbi:hypothetical protein T4A_9436 [Trichinella pseudospiralis]|uniref:Uncharacterized protein n=1 Tax=Trichinella pseudospiralis TaxID=6337 RepID=A0A0V1ER68_TRIPS|nr:hypothetical protein T4A_9436 [Trichinella pseudospiralis]